jgi:multiple RNA-binding domain-containing protein 1
MTEKRLKEAFSAAAKEQATDAKIMKLKSGVSRKFGFIGFSTPEAAERARKYMNQSYLDTSKISVELAVQKGSEELERPWSKHSKGSSKNPETAQEKQDETDALKKDKEVKKKTAKTKAVSDRLPPELMGLSEAEIAKLSKDPKFKEFMDLMGKKGAKKFWENDLMDIAPIATKNADDSDEDEEAFANPSMDTLSRKVKGDGSASEGGEEGSDEEEEVDDAYTAIKKEKEKALKVSDKDYITARQTDNFDSSDEEGGEDDDDEGESNTNAAMTLMGVDGDEESGDDNDSDSDNVVPIKKVSGKMSAAKIAAAKVVMEDKEETKEGEEEDEDNEGDSDSEEEEKVEEDTETKKMREEADTIGATGRLFLRNLSYSITTDDLRGYFGHFGDLSEVTIPLDSSKRPKGFAYIAFTHPGCAVKAFKAQDNTVFLGRLLHILPAKANPRDNTELDLDNMDDDTKDALTYKKKKELKLKKAAEQADTWNTLFIRSDTVVESIAGKYAVKKSDVLDRDAASMAVRVSLAETRLLKETKDFLIEQNVSMAAFQGKKSESKRSETVILVKNIPFETETDDLRRLFGKFGNLQRVVVPPAKTMALVEFVDKAESSKAFRALAYKKFKHVPLYLEWAPADCMMPIAAGKVGQPAEGVRLKTQAVAPGKLALEEAAGSAEVGDDDVGETCTIFVKNLSFETTAETLTKVFQSVGPVRTSTVARKKSKTPKGVEKWLSLGYGFVEYQTKADALKALKSMQGRTIDGHCVELKVSDRKQAPAAEKGASKRKREDASNKPGPKLLVKNLAFEANAKELRGLFGTFGQLKRCRLPKKFDGTSRGFAFVEFVTTQEAENAFDALQSTHLYGRHLVLQYANEDDNVEDIREKTRKKFEV